MENGNGNGSDTNVHKLFGDNPSATVQGMVNENIVGCLEKLLEEAKSGEINGFTFVGMTETGPYLPVGGGFFTNVMQAYLVLGVLDRLRATILGGIVISEGTPS